MTTCEGGEALAQVAQRSSGCPLPRSVQSQAGWGLEQPGLVEDVPARGWRAGLEDLQRSLPTQTNPVIPRRGAQKLQVFP